MLRLAFRTARTPRSLITARSLASVSQNRMAIELTPLPLPPSADASKFVDFGKEVKGVDPGNLTEEQSKEIEKLLYKVRAGSTLGKLRTTDK